MRLNQHWRCDDFEITCRNGEITRGAFIIDAHDRQVIAWRAVVNAGTTGSHICDTLLEAMKRRAVKHWQ